MSRSLSQLPEPPVPYCGCTEKRERAWCKVLLNTFISAKTLQQPESAMGTLLCRGTKRAVLCCAKARVAIEGGCVGWVPCRALSQQQW